MIAPLQASSESLSEPVDSSSDTDALPWKRRIVSELRIVCQSYAQIFFSSRWIVGALFLAATFVFPAQGLAGAMGLVLANVFAAILGLPRVYRTSGFYGYNGLLQGLALGLSYQLNTAFLVLFVTVSFLGVLIATNLRVFFDRFIAVPVLSLPFVVTTWLAIAASRRFSGLLPPDSVREIDILTGIVPLGLEQFAHGMGAAFFQLSLLSGVLVCIGLLVFSRHAFLLAAMGFGVGSLFFSVLGGDHADLNSVWVGFNFALTAIAVGGVFVVPGPRSFAMAAASAALCALVTAASSALLVTVGLPVLAFPFLVTTTIVIYSLQARQNAAHLSPIVVPEASPELNLKQAKKARARFVSGMPLFHLPVSGEWTITQGFDGEHTHKEQWAHAWDWEILDEHGNAFKNTGTELQDFYAYKKPVFAPADGKVVKIVDHVEDNQVGQTNQNDNWGNLIIIWHYGAVYTALCHLAKGSMAVAEGEVIRHGQRLARIGNSGRSPAPHLHFQAQLSHEIGAPTTSCELLGYITKVGERSEYHTHGIPSQGERVEALQVAPSRFDAASFPLGQSWTFSIKQGEETSTETWETDLDFAGNRFLVCQNSGAKLRLYVNSHVLLLLDYEGPAHTAMQWFFMAMPRMPLSKAEVYWNDTLPAELGMPWYKRLLFDLLQPVVELSTLNTISSFLATGKPGFVVETKLEASGLLSDKRKNGLRLVTHFGRRGGLAGLKVYKEQECIATIERVYDV